MSSGLDKSATPRTWATIAGKQAAPSAVAAVATVSSTSTAANHEKKPSRIETAARGEVVTVMVGPQSTKYHVHKAILMEHSGYFKKALQGPWKEADEGVVRLDDIEPETFGISVDWIYTQKLLVAPGAEDAAPGEEQSKFQIAKLKASVFGDRFMSPAFSKAVRHDLIHALTEFQYLYCKPVIYAYGDLPPEDLLLRFMEDVYCHDRNFSHTVQDGMLDALPKTFLLNVMKSLTDEVNMRGVSYSPAGLDECEYHGHASMLEGNECQSNS